MLSPNRTKFRKRHKGRLDGPATGCTEVSFGEVGIKAVEHGKLTSQQIEAARVAIMRHIKRGGKVWIRVFPDKPITKKPAETRMGKGKGAPEQWVVVIRPGKIMFEMEGVPFDVASAALRLAAQKLPIPTKIIKREEVV